MASGSHSVKLLSYWTSPFSIRVSLALELKGIEYENLPQDLINKSQLLLDSNPVYKKIPVLIHDGKPIPESLVILHYIDEVWPEKAPLLPKDPYLRAEHRFWAEFIDKKILDPLLRVLKAADEGVAAEANKDFIESWVLLEGALAKIGGDGPFFGGSSISYLDVAFAPFLPVIGGIAASKGLKKPSKDECPCLHKMAAAINEHPIAKAVLPSAEKLKEFYDARFKSQ